MKIIQESNGRYVRPGVKVMRIYIGTDILQSSLYGNPGINDNIDGSESDYGFGDED